MDKIQVAIIMGSDSDLDVMKKGAETLAEFRIAHEIRVLSAHRTPVALESFLKDAETRGCRIFICGAGMAAHLAGAVSARTTRPVIGVPLQGGILDGLDSLLSTVQMPPGMPVATVAVGGARNAAILAVQMLALEDADLRKALEQQREKTAAKLAARDAEIARRQ
ncbi:MAG: 5-(carboxyamino)imidazole ribonucleotide mutase [Candidatus Brocadiae bacterium]|nr:5-(carboxyamino)imidazole ribonucleotide mutase [Candidatus Brocadiia bacterium]